MIAGRSMLQSILCVGQLQSVCCIQRGSLSNIFSIWTVDKIGKNSNQAEMWEMWNVHTLFTV